MIHAAGAEPAGRYPESPILENVKVLPQPAVDLDQEAINALTIADIWGTIARILYRNCPHSLSKLPAFFIEIDLICSPGILR